MVEAVDYDKQSEEIEQMVAQLELAKASGGFNPYSNDGHKLDQDIQALIEKQVFTHFHSLSRAVSHVRYHCARHSETTRIAH
jgi:hypothetical protein